MKSSTMKDLKEIEREFKKISSSKEPETLSANIFHLDNYNILVYRLGFGHIGENFLIYRKFRDFFGYKPFRNTVSRFDVKDIPKSRSKLEEVTKEFYKHLSKKKKPENFSRMALYKRYSEKIFVVTHHGSPNSLLDGTLRSPNLNLSTNIVYNPPKSKEKKRGELVTEVLGVRKFIRTIKGTNLNEMINEKKNIVLETLEQDAIIKYDNNYIVPYILPLQAAEKKEANNQSLLDQLSISG
jgi:hypothetical protein